MNSYILISELIWSGNTFPQVDQPTYIENFSRDPLANSIAVIVLIFMVASAVAALISFLRESGQKKVGWPHWAVPLLALIGMGVSGYLLYVEWTGANAVCGPAGDCNAVQDSPYAKIFGLIPVGLLGLAGYLAILITWLLAEFGAPTRKNLFNLIIWGMAWVGVAFSIYLTFLEPFVIGATCMWCITSAIVITLILLASTGPAKEYLTVDDEDEEDEV